MKKYLKYLKYLIGAPVALFLFSCGLMQMCFNHGAIELGIGVLMTAAGGRLLLDVLSSLKRDIESN